MSPKYERKTNRQSWSEDSMKLAIEAVQSKQMGWRRASQQFGVPHTTLRRHAASKNKKIDKGAKGLGRYSKTFTAEVEKEIVALIQEQEVMFYGITLNELRRLAYDYAEANKISHRFSHSEKMAGWEWMRGFRQRNPEISLRSPEPTSLARAAGFNRHQVGRFFDQLQELMATHKFEPSRIYNMDESGLSTVQKPKKILATKGRKQVGAITSAERGIHSTMVCCISAAGGYIPPALIFSRKKWKAELIDGAPPETLGLHSDSGFMVGPIFLKWLKHFAKYANASIENKVLLILDGHGSHKYLEALQFAKQNGIILLCLPPHCTHKIQPLDVALFGPLTTYFNEEITKWLRNNPGRVVTQFQVARLFGLAYGRAATIGNAIKGFQATGIYPLNPDVFSDDCFAPATVFLKESDENSTNIGGSSTTDTRADVATTSSEPNTFLRDILPLPKKITTENCKRRNKTQKSEILTASPYIAELQKKENEKLELERKRQLRAAARSVKRKVMQDSDTDEEETIKEPYEEEDDNDEACIYCNELYSYSKGGEQWIRCQRCKRWSHTLCADVSPKCKRFVCELCL